MALGRLAGVARLPLGGELEREVALLRQAHQGHRRLHARHQAVGDHHAFIQQKIELDALLAPKLGQLPGTFVATHFLIGVEKQVDGLARLEPGFDQGFDRFQDGHHAGLVVPGATAPHEAVLDRA